MADFIKTQNSFANGEVAPEFFAHDGISGLSHMENMDVMAGGGLRRRYGLDTITSLNTATRLIPFSVSESENYLLVMGNGRIFVYDNDTRVANIVAPWTDDALGALQYAQRFGAMIFVHPDYQPRILQKDGTSFKLSLFDFSVNADMTRNVPFIKFDDADGITLSVSGSDLGNSFATLTASRAFWTQDMVNNRLLFWNKQWRIHQYISPTVVIATAIGGYTSSSETVTDWREAAFSTHRGWPCSITFHQDRLVFGGSRSWPGGIWMSQVGRHNNFDVGTGLDDEAIFITLLSERRQQICTVVSSDSLQILTSGGEWAISSKPLCPSSIDIKQHTSVGSVASRYLPPQKIEGATVFVSRNMRDIRQLCLDEMGEKYNATDLCALSKHLMNNPVDIAYNDATRQLFVVMADGAMAVLNHNSALGICAWSRYTTSGQFKSVATVNGITYAIVTRENAVCLERFLPDVYKDGGNYSFRVCASALPLRSSSHNASTIRVRKVTARVMDTKTLFINGVRALMPNCIYEPGAQGMSGDVSVNFLGVMQNGIEPAWTITSSDALPMAVLSVTVYGWYSIKN